MIISDAGNVGIGTLSPTTPLHVRNITPGLTAIYGESVSGSGEGVRGQSNSGAGVVGGSTTGTGVYGESAAVSTVAQAGVYGKGTGSGGIGVIGEANVDNAVGVFGLSSSPSGFALYARNTGGGGGIYSENNVAQNRDKGGLVKAMLYVNADGTIARCFNSFLTGSAASTGNCGFAVSRDTQGRYDVTFNFKVDDRFVSVTPRAASANLSGSVNIGATFFNIGSDTIRVNTFATDVTYNSSSANNPFMLIIY
jgi:hypothetical protein